jgi:hypothetical protein
VPPDLLYSVTAFSVEKDKVQPLASDGRQRALVTYYTGELPQKIKDEYIIHDGQAYSPHRRLTEALGRIPIMTPIKIKRSPGR